jgi:hypothetical protein
MSIKVVLGKEKEPTGVFIGLEDWNQVAPFVDSQSEFYQIMAGLTFKSVFELTDEEIQAKAKPIADAAKKQAWDNNMPISYQNEICLQEDMIIHEYKTGEKDLVSVSPENGSVKKLRRL